MLRRREDLWGEVLLRQSEMGDWDDMDEALGFLLSKLGSHYALSLRLQRVIRWRTISPALWRTKKTDEKEKRERIEASWTWGFGVIKLLVTLIIKS